MVKKVVIPLAGHGTRMYPASATLPKELLPIVNKPVMHYIMEEALASGIEEFIIVVSDKKFFNIKHYFDTHYPDLKVSYVMQNQMLGWMDSILLCEHEIGNEPFAFMLADNIFKGKSHCLKQLVDVFYKYKKSVIGVYHVPKEQARKYGILETEPLEGNVHTVIEFLEKPSIEQVKTSFANVGRNVFTPDIFKYLRGISRREAEHHKIDFVFDNLAKNEGFLALEYDGKWLDTGNPKNFVKSFWILLDDFNNLNGLKGSLR